MDLVYLPYRRIYEPENGIGSFNVPQVQPSADCSFFHVMDITMNSEYSASFSSI